MRTISVRMRKFSFYSIPTCLFVWIAEAPRNKLWQYISLSIWNKYLRKEGKLHQISTVSFLFNGQLLSMGKFHLPLCAKRYVVYECSLACNFSRPWNAGLSLDSYINKPQTEPINYNILLIRLFPTTFFGILETETKIIMILSYLLRLQTNSALENAAFN